MNNPIVSASTSPFDAIMRTDDYGNEYWSARDLMPLAGYGDKWQNFRSAIDRAATSAINQGHDAENHFTGASKVIEGGRWGTQTVEDFNVTRFGCYLIFQNGDPRKPEIAEAQGYFAIKTREAETAAPKELSPSELMAKALVQANLIIEASNRELEHARPAIEYHERYVSNEDAIIVADFAAQHGISSTAMFKLLRDAKIVYRQKVGEHFSKKRDRIVEDHEYRAYSGYLKFFDLRPQNNVVRYHNGQVRQTLYVRQAHALELAKLVGLKPAFPTTKELF